MVELFEMMLIIDLVLGRQYDRQIPEILRQRELAMLEATCKKGAFLNLPRIFQLKARQAAIHMFWGLQAPLRQTFNVGGTPTLIRHVNGSPHIIRIYRIHNGYTCYLCMLTFKPESNSLTIVDYGRSPNRTRVSKYTMDIFLESSDDTVYKGRICCAYTDESVDHVDTVIARFITLRINPMDVLRVPHRIRNDIRGYVMDSRPRT
jgi:hypothetical protein